jgi:hypothetical protein
MIPVPIHAISICRVPSLSVDDIRASQVNAGMRVSVFTETTVGDLPITGERLFSFVR